VELYTLENGRLTPKRSFAADVAKSVRRAEVAAEPVAAAVRSVCELLPGRETLLRIEVLRSLRTVAGHADSLETRHGRTCP
jgi:hypothetical protein